MSRSTSTTADQNGGSDAPGESARTYHVEILLISFAALLLEISYTRIISYKLFYYYTYLVIGLALLGLGAGSVLTSVSGRIRRASTDGIILWGLVAAALSAAAGYIVVARLSIASLRIWDYDDMGSVVANFGRLVVICVALFASFVAIGVMIATLFSRRTDGIGRLYFADLLGAGLACAVVVYLIQFSGPVATIFLAAAILAATAASLAWRMRPATPSPVLVGAAVLAVVFAVGSVMPDSLPEVRTDDDKASDFDAAHSEWSPIFRVDVVPAENGTRLVLEHDGLLGSLINQWDGDIDSLDQFEFDTDIRAFPFGTPAESPEKVMIIGAAGGHEILSSLYFDAERIDAIELNPATYGLVTDKYREFAGNLSDQPGVNYVNGDGRSYLARGDDDYNLIWYPAPDSYAAANAAHAGAFVLSESYLYTKDTIVESLDHLAEGGIVAAQFGEVNIVGKPNRTTRYVSTARAALKEAGVDDPSQHILVNSRLDEGATSGLSTVLVKETPFTPAEVDAFTEFVDTVPRTQLLYAPGENTEGPISSVITLPEDELGAWYDNYPYDVDPISDDAPFFWHFARFGDVIQNIGDPIATFDTEDSVGERVLLLLLLIAAILAAVFLLLPFVAMRRVWVALPRKGVSAVYFAALGLGFMLFEVSLIQRLVLFLGYPTYSLTVTLASILIFTGVGAFLSGRYTRPEQALTRLLPALFGLTLVYIFGLPALTDAALTWPIGARVVITFVVLAPLGVCLGTFMPLGLAAVARLTSHPSEYVAWGWAVNGFASVIGSVLTTLLAMSLGFNVVLGTGFVVYCLAMAALRLLLRTSPAEAPTEPAVEDDDDAAVLTPAGV